MKELTLNLTPKQQKLYDMLSDFQWHDRDELRFALGYDKHDSLEPFHVHVSNLRKFLPSDLIIVARQSRDKVLSYRLVRMPD